MTGQGQEHVIERGGVDGELPHHAAARVDLVQQRTHVRRAPVGRDADGEAAGVKVDRAVTECAGKTGIQRRVAEPQRRRILDLVRDGEHSVGELVAALSLSQPAVSKHLRVLREAGLVEARVDEQRRLYRLRPGPLRELDSWLAPYRQMWAASLDKLESHLDRMDDDDRRTPR